MAHARSAGEVEDAVNEVGRHKRARPGPRQLEELAQIQQRCGGQVPAGGLAADEQHRCAKLGASLVDQPQRRSQTVVKRRRPLELWREAVVHAHDGDAELIGHAAEAHVVLKPRRARIPPTAVHVQVAAAHSLTVGRPEDAHVDFAASVVAHSAILTLDDGAIADRRM
eukprot:2062860-Prymnesium_polylepis.1